MAFSGSLAQTATNGLFTIALDLIKSRFLLVVVFCAFLQQPTSFD